MLGLKRNTVMLCPHEKAWEDNAAETIRALKEILGVTAVRAAHVGSTAIVHIAAKPIIDIAVAVRELSDVEPYFGALGAAGFEHIPKNDDETQVFFSRGEGDLRTHYIHVVRADSTEWENYNNFRDYCNGRPDVAREYESLKRGLAEKYPTDRESYTQGKAEFITSALRKARSWVYLGKTLKAKIDSIGSRHPEHGFIYPVNYGYIEGIKGGDGEWQDCYILGVDEPLTEFTGLMAAVIYRLDDAEDKWVLCPPDYKPDQAVIAEGTEFVERYYTTEIEHLYHASCGMIVYRFRGVEPEFLILYQSRSRTYTVPKGHREAHETELQTAKREVLEEIGVSLEPTEDFYTKITYDIPPIYEKTVALYLCEYAGEVTLRQGEIARGHWYTLPECAALLTPQPYSALCEARDCIVSRRWKK